MMRKLFNKYVLLWLLLILIGSFVIYSAIALYGKNFISYLFNQNILLAINTLLLFVLLILLILKKFNNAITEKQKIAIQQPSSFFHNLEQGIYSDNFLIENIPNLLCIKDAKGRWIQASPDYLRIFNLTGADYQGKTDIELSEYPGSNFEALRFDASQDKKAWSLAKTLKDSETTASLEANWLFDITRMPAYNEHKQRFRLFITGAPLSKPEKKGRDIVSAVFFSSHIPFILLNSDFRIILVNHAFTLLTGFSADDVINNDLFFLETQEDTEDFIFDISVFFRNNPGQLWSREMLCYCRHNTPFPARIHVSTVVDQNNNEALPYYIVNIFDITQQKLHEQRIMQIAHYDDLTGLPNRVMFCDRLSEALSSSKRHNLCAVVLFLDLDRFKSVNDSLGHQAGNELLQETAKRLTKQVRKEDVVTRLSGDEFAVLLVNEKSHGTAIYTATMVAQKIITELTKHFYIQRQEVFIGASIGIAVYPEDADTVETLLKHADIAMYEAKRQGRNNFQFFNKKYTIETRNKHQLELGLRNALARNELSLYYQPQFVTRTHQLWGAEVLIRWKQGHTKMIPPGSFIPIAEEVGLIIPIGKWILETACAQQKHWLDEGYDIQQVSVNISGRQFMDPKFIDIVEEALTTTGLAAHYLELEITESMLIGDTRKIELQLNRLKKMGIKIALDDFGTGYSSLSYLKNFPIDILKIDQSFIRQMTWGSKDSRIARAIIDMGHSLGQKIVAEGVENEMQFKYLKQRGCDIIQGYYLSPPLPVNEMTKLLNISPK